MKGRKKSRMRRGYMPKFRVEKGQKYGCRKLRIPVQSFVNPPGYIQVKRRGASNRFTAFVEYKANGQSLSAKGHGGSAVVRRATAPEPVSEMGFLSSSEIRVALMLSLPKTPPPPHPHPPRLLLSLKNIYKTYIYAVGSVV
jgi:hypothetical protein